MSENTFYCKMCDVNHQKDSEVGKEHYSKASLPDTGTLKRAQKDCQDILDEVSKKIVGQKGPIKELLIAILCDGNILLEGYPGMAKTLMVKTLADVMDLSFSRIQNTPDLMPSDITGTYIIKETKGDKTFEFYKGPIFANIVLADEINRATPKTQAALLEAMQEKQITAGNKTYQLPEPFFVLATQNPIEQEGSLSMGEKVFINGELKTGKELLKTAGNCMIENENGMRLYELEGWTYSLNVSGELERQGCYLYTLPYKDEMITITTKTGKMIKVTKNHPFLVNDNGKIKWRKAEELTKHDYLVNPAKIPISDIFEPISHEDTLLLMKQKPIKEIPFDEDFTFWIAFVLSDGYVGEKCIEASQTNYPDALDRFIRVSEGYGFKVSVSTRKGCRHARVYSKPLVEYLRIRYGIQSGKDKSIPSIFLSLPKAMNREFLRTFISLESSINDNRITFTQKKEEDVNTISYMLLREGILPWIRHDGRVFRMKIQGKDFASFLNKIGWVCEGKLKGIDTRRTAKSSFRVVPVDRVSILKLVSILGLNSFHTLKNRKPITSRPWYGSYKGIRGGETLMSVDSLKTFVFDIKQEIGFRKQESFIEMLDANTREFSAAIGVPMTEIAEQLSISKNQVWSLYSQGTATKEKTIKDFLLEKHSSCLQEAGQLLKYCEVLLSEDVYYDKIKSISYSDPEGMAFGLTVPGLQNYLAGFGGCGINHNTFPLPEAQTDRFMFKTMVTYPDFEEENEIVERFATNLKPDFGLKKVVSKDRILSMQDLVRKVPIANDIKEYAVKIVDATRKNKYIQFGASPRASIFLVVAAKAKALVEGRSFVSEKDIQELAYPILRHRLILSFDAEKQGKNVDDIIKGIVGN